MNNRVQNESLFVSVGKNLWLNTDFSRTSIEGHPKILFPYLPLLNKLTKNGPYFAILFGEAIFCRDFLNSERFFITVCVLGFYVFVRLLAISKVLISACQSTFLTLSSR